ncbi:MAG: type II toxin-antitoxin system VapC family toxin [Bacteroidales bacterium]|nr:type II toxin-antitoxin system VapC family toxin [Bacteroidales bacterium]
MGDRHQVKSREIGACKAFYEQIIPQQIEENDIELLPIAHNHLTKIIDLPFHHRDPFDRLIIAQAMTEGIPIISPDAAFSQYPIKLIW